MTKHRDRTELVLDFLDEYIARQGYAPSLREIGKAVGLLSTSSVAHCLEQLERDGRIRQTPGIGRSIVLVEP